MSTPCDPLLEIALDLTATLSASDRAERLLGAVRRVVPGDAAALLRLEGDELRPVAVRGLPLSLLERRLPVRQHPRLERILAAPDFVHFADDDPMPDPYDDLIDVAGLSGRVHSCLGIPLRVGEDTVGCLTVDALAPRRFDHINPAEVRWLSALAAATMRSAWFVESLKATATRREEVAAELVNEALQRHGGGLVGDGPAMKRLQDEMVLVARSDLPVFITGETGVGKELVARTLHARSPRANRPLVAVNCAAVPPSLAESELFGHVRGAFTGAVADRPGRFELADGGTLFLDEVGELPLPLQSLLLRAIQFGEVQRVGARRETTVNVRVIAATNRDLKEAVAAGEFRDDLLHRLSVFPLHVPALRERREDIPALVAQLLDRAQQRLNLGALTLTDQAMAAVREAPWPGNVRELEHALLRAALRASRGRRVDAAIGVEHLEVALPAAPAAPPRRSLAEETDALQRRLVAEAIDGADGNLAAAARSLGMDRSNLHRLAKRLGLKHLD